MSSPNRFCTQCGASLSATARFCGSCGHVAAPAAPAGKPLTATPQPAALPPIASAAPATGAEPVLGVIPGLSRKKGLMGSQAFCLMVTPSRLAFVVLTPQMMNEAVRQANAEAKRQGKGWLGQMAAQMHWLHIIGERYLHTPVEAALAEHPDNFYLPNDQIKKIKFDESHPERGAVEHTMVVEAQSGKYGFAIKGGPSPKESKQMLQSVLGPIVK